MTDQQGQDYDKSIHTNPSAMAWTEMYKETFPDADEELMLGWFANAMMAMHDHIKLNLSDHIPEGYALVPVNSMMKVDRSSDFSVTAVFSSCRTASEFQKALNPAEDQDHD